MSPVRWSTRKFVLVFAAWALGNAAAVGWLAYDSRPVMAVRK